MTPLFTTSFHLNDHVIDFIIIYLIVMIAGIPAYMARPTVQLRRIERKLDALLKQEGVPLLSDEVQTLASNPGRKIAAIKLHREQAGLGIAEAKTDVEEYIKAMGGAKASSQC